MSFHCCNGQHPLQPCPHPHGPLPCGSLYCEIYNTYIFKETVKQAFLDLYSGGYTCGTGVSLMLLEQTLCGKYLKFDLPEGHLGMNLPGVFSLRNTCDGHVVFAMERIVP